VLVVRSLVREQLIESLLLAGAAGVSGAALGWALLRVTMALAAGQVPRLDDASIDWRVLLIAAGAALSRRWCVVPSRLGVRRAWIPVMRCVEAAAESRRRIGRSGGSPVDKAALAVVLLTGSGLLVRSLIEMQRVRPGFDVGRHRPAASRPELDRGWEGQGPGLLAAVARASECAAGREGGSDRRFPDRAQSGLCDHGRRARDRLYEQVTGDPITPGFFEAAGVRLLSGRMFTAEDFDSGPLRTAIINRTMARRFWPEQDAVGKRMQFGPVDKPAPWITVIGVVEDMRRLGLERRAVCEAFGPGLRSQMDLIVRASPPRESLSAEVRSVIRDVDPSVPVYGVAPLKRLLRESTLSRKLQTTLLAGFAALTLLMAAVGCTARCNRQCWSGGASSEFVWRWARPPAGVLRLVLTRGLVVAGMGAAAGTVAAFWLARTLEALLFEVAASDPWALDWRPS